MLKNQNFSSNTLILLETAAQADWLATQARQGLVVAVTPQAAYSCQKLGLSYQKIEDYAQVTKRLAEYTPILQCYLEWETWLDKWAQQTISEFGTSGFKPAGVVTFFLQLLFAEIWATSVSLKELLEATKPAEIALWPPEIIDVPWHLQPMVSPVTILASTIAEQAGIGVVNLSQQAPDLKPVARLIETPLKSKQFLPRIKAWLRQKPWATDLVQDGFSSLWPYLKPTTATAPHFLFSGYGYDLSPLARELRRQGAQLTVLSDTPSTLRLTSNTLRFLDSLKPALALAWERLIQEPSLWKPLNQWGVGRTPLWSKPLNHWWHHLVPEFWIYYQQVDQLMKRHKFAKLITWDLTGSTLSSAAANVATAHQIPRFVYQHGSSSGIDARLWAMYLRYSDTFLAYGAGTVDEFKQSCPDFLSTQTCLEPVGSPRLDLLRQQHQLKKAQLLRTRLQAGDARPLVLYIPTCFGTYGRAVSDIAAYPDISYFELQQKILSLWQDTFKVRLVYKEFIVANDPNSLVMRDFIQTHISDAIVTNQRLTDLMWAVDAIVVDHVITAIGEVLLTNKPLVVYMPQPSASSPQAIKLLRKRAAVAETPEEFATEVRLLLQRARYSELENHNTEFLQHYCTHLHDGQSAQRAASILLQERREQPHG